MPHPDEGAGPQLTVRGSGRQGVTLAFGARMAAILLYVVCSITACWFYPGSFTPFERWLSELGDRVLNPRGAPFYNAGCVLTTLALLLFVLGLNRWRSGLSRGRALFAPAKSESSISSERWGLPGEIVAEQISVGRRSGPRRGGASRCSQRRHSLKMRNPAHQ